MMKPNDPHFYDYLLPYKFPREIWDSDLPVRCKNVLANMKVESLLHAAKITDKEYLRQHNFGETSLKILRDFLESITSYYCVYCHTHIQEYSFQDQNKTYWQWHCMSCGARGPRDENRDAARLSIKYVAWKFHTQGYKQCES